jgi:Homeodomain
MFKITPRPWYQDVKKLATKLQLSEEQVELFFSRERMRAKKRAFRNIMVK